jgi:transcriptional regulator of acetoin/glycerol metabolism
LIRHWSWLFYKVKKNNTTVAVKTSLKHSLKEAEEAYEKCIILEALERNNWKMIKTAKELDIDRSNLFKKMRKHGIEK